MNFTGLGVGTFVASMASLLLGLGLLHLLRVRMRRQVVDSLLFFRSAALDARPRVLGHRLTRLGSFLLCAAVLTAAWTAFAEPRGQNGAPSRIVLVDHTDSARASTESGTPAAASFDDEAAGIASSLGLGPRGGVIAVNDGPHSALRADEPIALLHDRLAAISVGGAPSTFEQTLVDVAHSLRPGDEIVVVGGSATPPSAIGAVAVRAGNTPALLATASDSDATPRGRPTVFVADDLPRALGLAVDALGIERADRDTATIAIVRGGTELPKSTAGFVIEDGDVEIADGTRMTDACPAPLSLRDHTSGRSPAFMPAADEAIWVGDGRNRAAVVAASEHRVRAVAAFFTDFARRDVPLLVEAAILHLSGLRGAPSTVPIPATAARNADALGAFGGNDALAPWLIACALLLLCLDAFLLGRGRVA